MPRRTFANKTHLQEWGKPEASRKKATSSCRQNALQANAYLNGTVRHETKRQRKPDNGTYMESRTLRVVGMFEGRLTGRAFKVPDLFKENEIEGGYKVERLECGKLVASDRQKADHRYAVAELFICVAKPLVGNVREGAFAVTGLAS